MKIALVQMNPITGDISGNTKKIIKEIENAKKDFIDLIIFPEMAVTGYCISDLIEDKSFVSENINAIREIQKSTSGIIAVIGFIDIDSKKKNEDGKIRRYNAAVVLQNKKIIGKSYKTLLPNYRYFDDKRYFSSSEKRKPISVNIKNKIIKLGISICEDMWDDDYEIKPIKELAEQGADLIININASPFYPKKRSKRNDKIKQHIKNFKIPFVYVNTVGASDNGKNIIPFDGESLFYDEKGNLLALGNQFKEETIIIDLDKKLPSIKIPELNNEKEVYEALVMSLKDYALKTGFKKAIIPISGGIDSSLGLAITVDAFGAENVSAYNLPSKFNTEITKSIAKKLASNLNIEYKIVPIQTIDNEIKSTFEKNSHEIKNKVAKENIHARIRGILMMLESNDTGSLLISNGNETEIALGYATLYGDMCGGISIIGDLTKIDVYKISRYVNKKYKKEIIPEEVFKIKPSAELSEGQFDPFDYDVVAPIVNEFVENRIEPKDLVNLFKKRKLNPEKFLPYLDGKIIYDKYDIETFKKLVYETYNLLRKSVYKRLQGPPIIVVSERAFGFDLRETLINKWEGK
ncbi:MAG TPA: NAD(+) synthase [Candidatus Nanoarchaeia archaeon]|nr:NAD(+) synthase [Candidatus Nanoarchaeia archaeon]